VRRWRCALGATWVLAAALVAAVPAPAADERRDPFARGLLFRLDKPGVPSSFVFGTMHSGDPRVAAIPAVVLEAFSAARTFALESRLVGGEIDRLFAAAQFDDGRRLTDYFDPASFAAIRAALGAGAPPPDLLVRLKPWALLLKLAEQPIAGGGVTLDQKLLDEARRRRLAIVGLELPDEQIAAFDAIPIASQVALVRFVLAHRDTLLRDYDAVLGAWLDRDLAGMAALNLAPGRRHPEIAPHYAELTRHLIENRSVQMAHRLFVPLRNGRVFVAVGALHLHGERGLLALLREQGYRVRTLY
jgi:uncharacterized protein YbaP (TraB family)